MNPERKVIFNFWKNTIEDSKVAIELEDDALIKECEKNLSNLELDFDKFDL